jgi:hypothetical protein
MDALTPAGPFVITHRGSLIHVTRTSHHSVSNPPRFSARRVPLPQRWPLYFVRASPWTRRLARTADRIEFTFSVPSDGRRYGLMVHFQLLSTRGYRPDAVTFSCWPFSVGQVRDFHPAVPVRSQAHESRLQPALTLPTPRSATDQGLRAAIRCGVIPASNPARSVVSSGRGIRCRRAPPVPRSRHSAHLDQGAPLAKSE